MKSKKSIRKIITVLLVFIGFFGMCMLLLNYSVNRYHQSRIEKHIPVLEKLKSNSPSQEQIQDALGMPYQLLSPDEALKLSSSFFHPVDETVKKCIKYPSVMFYRKGDIVYFIFLNDEGKMADFSIGRN